MPLRAIAALKHVGAPRIELGPHAPEACILPLYYAPIFDSLKRIEWTYGESNPDLVHAMDAFYR